MDGLEVETIEVPVDASGKVSIPVPEGHAPAAELAKSAPEFTGAPGNFMQDLAVLAAERAARQQAAPPAPVVEPTPPQPETTKATATAPVTDVPAKFKNEDGTASQEKIAKSTFNAEEALAKYAEIERKLRQTQNGVAALRQGAPVSVPTAALPAQVNTYSPFEVQVAQDLIQAHAEAGIQLPQGQALAQARVSVKLLEARHAAEASLTDSLRERLDSQDRRTELESIALNDPWVMSPEGIETLGKIRESYQHVNASPRPWTAAYDQHLANQVKQQRLAGQVTIPTPTARTARPPATPVQAVARVTVKPTEPNFSGMTSEQISAHAASLGPKGEAAFWASRGLKF